MEVEIRPEVITWLNNLEHEAAQLVFRGCCGADWWCQQMVAERPFATPDDLLAQARQTFEAMSDDAWIESFNCHPRIGDMNSLRMKFAGNKKWSAGEQAGVTTADESTLKGLADGNHAYDARFGYPFIVCATGKSATEMLSLLQARLGNTPNVEFPIACGEQKKITLLRLAKLQPKTDA